MDKQTVNKVKNTYADFLEKYYGILLGFFTVYIPESFLPLPKAIIQESLLVLREYFKSLENTKAIEAIDVSLQSLDTFVSDDLAIKMLKKIITTGELSNKLEKFRKEVQDENYKNLVSNTETSLCNHPTDFSHHPHKQTRPK